MILLFVAAVTLALYVRTAIELSAGGSRIEQLHQIRVFGNSEAPWVSAVIPACNEERSIRRALLSVLSQKYSRLEVIAVDDRSTDKTGVILDSIASSDPHLTVVHITSLPDGWLGKNNALAAGASVAHGEWLLFADADVVMDESVLSRAMRYVTDNHLDHLAVAPRAIVGGFLSRAFLGTFALLFSMHTRPWKVRDPHAREYIGIGAFNLVRSSAYSAVGGHSTIALRPDDDLQLGRILKRSGYRQDLVFGTELMTVEWYESFAAMRNGLMKNMFAVLNYNLTFALGVALLQFVLLVWPWIAVIVTTGPVRCLNGAAVVTACTAFVANARLIRMRPLWCFATPIGALVSIYLLLRSAFITIRTGGISWRGTHYSLSELRKQRVPLA